MVRKIPRGILRMRTNTENGKTQRIIVRLARRYRIIAHEMFYDRKHNRLDIFYHIFVNIWWIQFLFGYDTDQVCLNMSPKYQSNRLRGRCRNCTRQFACRSFVYLCDFDDNAINFVIFNPVLVHNENHEVSCIALSHLIKSTNSF